MSIIRTVESIALASAIFVGGVACNEAKAVQGPQKPVTPLATPTKTAELGGTLFEQASCNNGEITFPKPMGWSILEVPVTPNLTNCYVSKDSLTKEENFRNGLSIRLLNVPWSVEERVAYARQLATRPSGSFLPVANTFKEGKEGAFAVFSGRFIGNSKDVYVRAERRVYVSNNSNLLVIVDFDAPEPTFDEKYNRFGKPILEGIKIRTTLNGKSA